MKFTCDRCDAQYMISDEKVGPNGVKVRCKKCSHIILVRRAAENGAAAAEAPAPAPAPSPGGSGEGLDAELGQAFDNAFGDAPVKTPATAPDPDSTQAVSPEEAASVLARSAPPEPAANEWYVAIGQAQVGPLPLVEVRRKWEAGDIGPDSLVWRPGMGDWAALTGVSDLAAYLAPVARGAARPQPQAAPAPALARAAPAAAAAAEPRRMADVSWKPVGASALAALASEEIAGQPAEPKAESRPVVSAKSLVDGLPDGGGVDPTGAVPLQIKALESTGEAPVARSTVARGAEKLRKRRSSNRALMLVTVLLLLALVGGGGYVGYDLYLKPRLAPPAPVPPVASAEKPAVAEKPAPPPAQPPAAPAASASAQPAPPPAAPATPPPAAAATEAAAAPATPPPAVKEPEEAKPEPVRPAREPARTARAEKKAHEPPARAERVAKAEPPPRAAAQPAPAKKKGNDLLDFDSTDSALDDALGGQASSGRSVYVPPAPGGGDALPQRVTDSQVNETIMTRVSALQQCLSDNKSGGSGVLKMRWAIAPDGSVQNLKCISPESANTPFAGCVTGVLKGLRFPKTVQGRSEVTFPFKF